DEFNYGGKACQEVVERDEQDLQMIMHWQMATFLPVRLQPIFSDWVVEFIQLMHGIKRPANGSDPTATPRLTRLPVRTGGGGMGEGAPGQILLGKVFEKPLKKEISGLINTQKRELLHPELAGDYTFPELPGSYLPHLTSQSKPDEQANGKRSPRASANPALE